MKQLTLSGLAVALLLLISSGLSAQRYFELGLQGGDMPFNGDLSDPGIGFLKDWNTYGGFYLRYRPISRVGLRLNGIFGQIAAERELSVRNASMQPEVITREFQSSIREFSLALEFDLFYLGDPEGRVVAPYLMAGVGRTAFNPQARLDGVYVDLQPLRTEGQGAGPEYDPLPYDRSITTLHLGGGVRAKIGERFVIGGEVSGRVTGTDYLDDVTGRQLNYNEVLAQSGTDGAFFSNPAVTPGEAPDNLTYRRGGQSNDFYFLINLTLGIRLGDWGGGGSGCYTF